MINELFVYSKDLMDTAVNSDSIKILYKAIGSAFIIQYASDLSRDCGVESIASKLEIVGRIYIISLCIPLVKELISTVNNF